MFFSPASRQREPGRKDLQLCRQTMRILALALGECGDSVLQQLFVLAVEPAPNASCLLVSVSPGATPACAPDVILLRLSAANGFLRARVAEGVVRRKAPQLLFRVAGPAELQP